MQIGFIGLGTMGRPMLERLIGQGHHVRCTRIKPASEYLLKLGVEGCDSPTGAAAGSDVIILMVPDTADVERVLFAEDGVVNGLQPNALVIDMSSISPVATKDFAARIAAAGGRYLDAPVSGGEIGAREGTLSIMVGGSEADFTEALPLFQAMGKNITRVGEVGSGQVCKVANQIIVGLTIEAVAEAFLLAERAGADVAKVREALMGGFAQSRILEVHGKRMIEGTFEPGFKVKLHRKDLNIATGVAHALEFGLPGTALTVQLMNSALAQGLGEKDHSALFLALQGQSS